jgi:hypothetical protein
MDALKKEIQDELQKKTLDKNHVYDVLSRLVDAVEKAATTGGEVGGSQIPGPRGQKGEPGAPGPRGPAGPAGPAGTCECKCASKAAPAEAAPAPAPKKTTRKKAATATVTE